MKDIRMTELFNELIPAVGKADTVAGELLRATGRLRYRFYNDGDKVLSGYGNETCNGSLRYLTHKLEELPNSEELYDEFDNLWSGDSMCDVEYEGQLELCVEKMLDYIDENTDLKYMKNLDDSISDFNEPDDYDYDDEEDDEDDYYDDRGDDYYYYDEDEDYM